MYTWCTAMCGLEEAKWSRFLSSHLFLDTLSKLTVFIPLRGRRWRMLLLGAHLHWARLCGTARYSCLSMVTDQFRLEHKVMSTAHAGDIPDHGLIPGLISSFSSALDSDVSALFDCVFTFVRHPCLRKPGLKIFWPTVPQSAIALNIEPGSGGVRGLSLPSALKFRRGSLGTCSGNNVSLKKEEAWDSGCYICGLLLVEMNPTGRKSLRAISSRTAPDLCVA